MNEAPLLPALLAEIGAAWCGLPDKPDEDADKTLRALWLSAAGRPVCIQRVDRHDLPSLDERAEAKLRSLVAQRLGGTPLA